MICTGSISNNSLPIFIQEEYLYNYFLKFNKNINYCDEIIDSFNTLKDKLISYTYINKSDKDLIIQISHNTNIATKETDLFFIFLTSLYYDCIVTASSPDKNYQIRLVDGEILGKIV